LVGDIWHRNGRYPFNPHILFFFCSEHVFLTALTNCRDMWRARIGVSNEAFEGHSTYLRWAGSPSQKAIGEQHSAELIRTLELYTMWFLFKILRVLNSEEIIIIVTKLK
jgi:hypothetical protein